MHIEHNDNRNCCSLAVDVVVEAVVAVLDSKTAVAAGPVLDSSTAVVVVAAVAAVEIDSRHNPSDF